ncbi:STAS domain-containing protein [Effusibacillus lacus]|uniref:Anti-sigma factor antagonist n=1 Tax=Effusibacillus lacus TaxID=1348429 RepID=A0A292YP11_9BACL|nr:STAS domain-containing protein [Effusibacillus lacus]TCS70653.1 anti-sigma-factor antagonist [Effusibacillus lacus]GAX90651.1 anti-sigma factor antagonist [Effusibacillus lacus]
MIKDIKVTNDQVIVILTGSIYVGEATVLRERLLEHVERGLRRFVIDMSDVDYIDSSGLGVLVALQKRALQNKGGVVIKGLAGTVKELFELTRLTKVFEIQ